MIIVKRTYTPMAGASGLGELLNQVNSNTVAAEMPEIKVFRKFLGHHGVMVTMQAWESLEAYEASRSIVRNTSNIRDIFMKIYPLLSETHITEILEEAN
ncbi:MAG: hypothetical protein VX869_07490 [Chloroflexota bacterium]|uniref:ABM domain-containing protein n=1 Tax=marine metagenome TaxID=408172 RepID=A0A381TNL9_9ZZZZ|nr:hypothetical protein [Chloroflexota bacterium]MEC9279104.1 hypothetical protein [Chloroflexota bacterium]MEC9322002.1 hypothetical protein [Chloroflexota bacterium]|tara:strand:- start:118 stop:414 length:297 start_codon:yes stop_codon:yes gene_type:complete